MTYFTDMLLIPGGGSPDIELAQALAGTGMRKCAQINTSPELRIDLNKASGSTAYAAAAIERVRTLMNDRLDNYVDTSGGRDELDPERSHLVADGDLLIRLDNLSLSTWDFLDTAAEELLVDRTAGTVGEGFLWRSSLVENDGDSGTVRLSWEVDKSYVPEPNVTDDWDTYRRN